MGDRTILAPPAFDYADYSTSVIVFSSIVSVTGIAAHLFIFLSCFRVREDHKTFLLIQQSTSLFAVFGLLTGGLGSVRHEVTDTYAVFMCYGLVKYSGSPRLCAVLDLFPGMHVPLSSVFVTIMMAFRCLGLMGLYFETKHIYLVGLLCVAVTLPLPVFTALNYVDVSGIHPPMASWLQHEWTTVPSYGVEMTATMTTLFILYNILSTVSLGFGISTAVYSHFAVRSTEDTKSNGSLELHQSYFRMLYFEIFTMSIYAVATQLSSSNLVTLPPAINFYLNAFNFVVFALPTVLQETSLIVKARRFPYSSSHLFEILAPEKARRSPEETFSPAGPPGSSGLDEKLPLLCLSIFLSLVGIFSHSVIFALSYFRFKEDNKSFVLFTKFHSIMSIIGLIGGSLSSASRQWLDEVILYRCYSNVSFLRSVVISHYASLIWTFFSFLSPLLVTAMMAYRCLGFHGKTMTIRGSWLIIGYVVGISVVPPSFYEIGYNVFNSHKDTFNLTLPEIEEVYGVSIYFNNWPVMIYLNYSMTAVLVFCFLVNVVTTLLSYRVVASVPTLSPKLRNMYTSYFNLLLFCSYLMTICQFLTLLNDLNLFSTPTLQILFETYSFPLTALPNVILGLGSIWFIPYMRNSILQSLRIKNIAIGDIAIERDTVSDHSARRNPPQLLNAISDRPRIFVTTVPCRGVCYFTRHTGQEVRYGPALSHNMEMR